MDNTALRLSIEVNIVHFSLYLCYINGYFFLFYITDYMRTGCAFSVITIILMFLVHAFAAYTIRRPRYTFKRLTALLHIMTGKVVLALSVKNNINEKTDVRTINYLLNVKNMLCNLEQLLNSFVTCSNICSYNTVFNKTVS